MDTITIVPKTDLFFDLKVREMCKWCKRYGKKAFCPPYIKSVEFYSNLLPKYKHGQIFYTFSSSPKKTDKNYGKESSLAVHSAIASARRKLFSAGHYFINAFGAGSCKLCESCSFPCGHPDNALIPVEATGMDVVKMMNNFKISIKFPAENQSFVYRIGVILYD